jgi:hypothetical protein
MYCPRKLAVSTATAVLALALPVSSQWSGPLTGNTVWTKAQSSISVNGMLTAPAGDALTINSGVTVQFAAAMSSGIDVFGAIVASGISTDSVTFTSASSTPVRGDWSYITTETNALVREGTYLALLKVDGAAKPLKTKLAVKK